LTASVAAGSGERPAVGQPDELHLSVALLTGADDRSYAVGLAGALLSRGVAVDFIGSDTVEPGDLSRHRGMRFLNLRGDQTVSVPAHRKLARILRYYARLLAYAVTARPRVFHVLWNNKFQHFDRTLLMLWYRAWGRRVVLTAHNVNAARRDGRDSAWNRATLRIQYRLAEHVFVHTARMQSELCSEFGIDSARVTVIRFGLNETNPITDMSAADARARLGLESGHRVVLFFGQIAPYKGLEYLIAALPELKRSDPGIRVLVAGKVKSGHEEYWNAIAREIAHGGAGDLLMLRREFVPPEEIEVYFKAADLLVLPYVEIFQSGVPFLGYSFGVPVVATDVGSLREDVLEGETGFVCAPQDARALAAAVLRFFRGDLHARREATREHIKRVAADLYSWDRAAQSTCEVYSRLSRDRASA
jgi:glycosyltransferase involved in cell wall biosynthesis